MAHFSGENLLCYRGERTVFADLSFDCRSGGALILRGPNGSGKSTLLRLMAGLLKAQEGLLTWNGEDIREEPDFHNERLHYVGHADAVKPVLTVTENISFWAEMRNTPGHIRDALDAFGITYLADVPGRFLSAGQKRRVNLARIKASKAELWLLDEPTTALDADAVHDLEREIGLHRAGGGMVVASTHADLGLIDAQVLNLGDYQLRNDVL